jgi:hypothetical protein
MVGASIDNDWSAALWREELEEGVLLAAAADADEILLMLLLFLLLRKVEEVPRAMRKRRGAAF